MAFDLSSWKVKEIEKYIGRDIPIGFHSMKKGYIEYDDTRNGCAFDTYPSRMHNLKKPPHGVKIIQKQGNK